jgi:hypothetical protein
MYVKDIAGNVPLYGQEMCVWCGAASAQMSRNGYPNPPDRLFYTQLTLWNSIQANNSTSPGDFGWAVLQTIHYHDPEPHNVGTDTMMTAAQWYGGPWNGAVMYGGTWLNEYVAIIEPPLTKGQARVKQVKRTGDRLLKPAQAVAAARRWIEEHHLGEMSKYSLLSRKDAEALTPLLVREEPPVRPGGQRARSRTRSRSAKTPHYYIVPFGIRGERSEAEAPSPACVSSSTDTQARSRR